MKRKIVHIDEELCNGCGACVSACHEGAIELVNGKARLIRDDYCDGLGDCLPACPVDAIKIEEREALPYDEIAVQRNMMNRQSSCSCPGSNPKQIKPMINVSASMIERSSQLSTWPVQIQLAPINAPYFDGANLLVAADCSAYAYANFHETFIRGRVCLVGCPKLDPVDYSQKLEAIFSQNDIRSLTIVRMEVPCCGGLEHAAKTALQRSGKFIPWNVFTISTDGQILDR